MKARAAAGVEPHPLLELPVLLAACAAWQAGSPTVRALHSARQDQAGAEERLRALVGIFAPRDRGGADRGCLRGSFNVLISEQLMVGQRL